MKRPLRVDGQRKREEAAFLLPIFGLFLLLPPMITLFSTNSLLFGIPTEVLYVFAIWMLLIGAAIWAARGLPQDPQKPEDITLGAEALVPPDEDQG